jgi:DnaJ-domain-containing protein 1
MTARRRSETYFRDRDAPSAATHTCAWPGCREAGDYRAPCDRSLREYDHYCLAHVREYNKRWNYYADMSEAEVEESVRADTTWQRPSWKLGHVHAGVGVSAAAYRAFKAGRVKDSFDFFEEESAEHKREQRRNREYSAGRPPRGTEQDQAMRVMDLEWPLTKEGLKARYKELVKRYHPDLNPGDRAAEERFKAVNHAYRTLLNALNA